MSRARTQQTDGGRLIAAVPDLLRTVTVIVVLPGVAALVTVLSAGLPG
jgi:hypothetical protein